MFTSRVRDRNDVQLSFLCCLNWLFLFKCVGAIPDKLNTFLPHHTTRQDVLFLGRDATTCEWSNLGVFYDYQYPHENRLIINLRASCLSWPSLQSVKKLRHSTNAKPIPHIQSQNFHLGQQRASTLVTWQSVEAVLRKNIRTMVLYPFVFMHTLLIEWFHLVS